jgi:hypothetical protein
MTDPARTTKECPGCGKCPAIDDDDFIYPMNQARKIWYAQCPDGSCDWSTLGKSAEDALRAWNKRTDAADALRDQLAALQAENERMSWWIDSRGYRRCDIPACNCPYWHGGNVEARLDEFKTELSEHVELNGKTLLDGLKQITAELAAAQAKLAVPVDVELRCTDLRCIHRASDAAWIIAVCANAADDLESLARDNAALRKCLEDNFCRTTGRMSDCLIARMDAWLDEDGVSDIALIAEARRLVTDARARLAAHDAAMAAEPDVQALLAKLVWTLPDDTPCAALQEIKAAFDALLLRLQAAQQREAECSGRAEIRLNDDGSLDEVVGTGSFQLEQMSGEMWFVSLGDVAVWLRARKSTISATHESRAALVEKP